MRAAVFPGVGEQLVVEQVDDPVPAAALRRAAGRTVRHLRHRPFDDQRVWSDPVRARNRARPRDRGRGRRGGQRGRAVRRSAITSPHSRSRRVDGARAASTATRSGARAARSCSAWADTPSTRPSPSRRLVKLPGGAVVGRRRAHRAGRGRAPRRASGELAPDDRVLVLGAGPIALGAVFWARRMGAGTVVVMATSEPASRTHGRSGPPRSSRPSDDAAAAAIDALGGPADVVIEAAGAPGTIEQAMQIVKATGTVVALGWCTVPDTYVPALYLMQRDPAAVLDDLRRRRDPPCDRRARPGRRCRSARW